MKRTKKFLGYLLSVLMILISIFSVAGCNEISTSKNLKFSLSNEQFYILTDVTDCKDKKIVIPSYYKGKPVKQIISFVGKESNGIDVMSGISIVIPKSVIQIHEQAFLYAQFANIEVNKNNKNYTSIDGNLYSKDKKTLIQYASGKNEAIFTIPDGVEVIENSACANSFFSVVIIPESVKSIGGSLFANYNLATSTVSFIEFKGTVEQWNTIEKHPDWNFDVGVEEIFCSDGVVEIEAIEI